jgi:hypothetical protein
LFTQDSAGVGGAAEEGDAFGRALATGDFNQDGLRIWPSVPLARTSVASSAAAQSTCCMARPAC